MSHHHIPKHSVRRQHHQEQQNQRPKISVKNVTTQSDYEELRKAYTFIPSSSISSVTKTDNNETWQQRMVMKYHEHLYKSHVIADFSKQTTDSPNNIGLRWRIKSEVMNGKGFETCGNKHCLCYFEDNDTTACYKNNDKRQKRSVEDIIRWRKNAVNRMYLHNYENDIINDKNKLKNSKENQTDQDHDNVINNNNNIIAQRENQRLIKVPHGLGLFDYTVHFQYEEQNKSKEELVQLKLCLRCAPKLFLGSKGGVVGALKARMKQENEDFSSKKENEREDRISPHQSRYSSSLSNRSCSSCSSRSNSSTRSNDNSSTKNDQRKRSRKKRKHKKMQSPTSKERKHKKKTR